MPYTLVSFHAHPDDESLLTGGTLARTAAEGHRVVLVTATDGAAGLSGVAGEDLGRRRRRELDKAATLLGVARVVHLGYPDGAFSDAGLDGPASRLAGVVEEESADVLTGYDPAGGYGHPDHVHVHRVARRVAALEPGVGLLEATVDRGRLLPVVRVLARIPGTPPIDLEAMRSAYLPREELTHRVNVKSWVPQKVAALGAHESQQSGGSRLRTVSLLQRLPAPLARAALGWEWFREVDASPGALADDIFAHLRR